MLTNKPPPGQGISPEGWGILCTWTPRPGRTGRLTAHLEHSHVWFHWHARADHHLRDRAHHLRPPEAPELGKSLGRSLNEFKKASNDLQNTLEQEIKLEEQKENGRRPQGRSDAATPDHRPRDTTAPSQTVSALALPHGPGAVPQAGRGIAAAARRPSRREASSPFGDEDARPLEGRMTFLEHLDELRKRITHAVVALLVGLPRRLRLHRTGSQAFVYARLTADIPGGKLIYTEPGEGFFLYIKIAALVGPAHRLAVRDVAGVALHRARALREGEEAGHSVRRRIVVALRRRARRSRITCCSPRRGGSSRASRTSSSTSRPASIRCSAST